MQACFLDSNIAKRRVKVSRMPADAVTACADCSKQADFAVVEHTFRCGVWLTEDELVDICVDRGHDADTLEAVCQASLSDDPPLEPHSKVLQQAHL